MSSHESSFTDLLAKFKQFILSGCTGSFIVRNEADGSVKFAMYIKENNKMNKKKKAKSPARLRRDAKRKAERKAESRKESRKLNSRKAVEKPVTPPSLSTRPITHTNRAIASQGELEKGLETTETDFGESDETGSNQSTTDSDLDSIGRKKYHQAVLKMEDFKLCRNYSVKLHAHKACTIPNKKIDSIKACNRNPDSGGISYSTHSCSNCIDNPPLVKTVRNELGQISYQVHESVEEFKVCTSCTKYKTSKVCTLLNKTMIQKKEASNATGDRDDVNKRIDDLCSLLRSSGYS